jgi:photosystem II stability/assembly factor-like uncharacterized protein
MAKGRPAANSAIGIAFSILVFLAVAYAFSPRPLPAFPETTVRPETLLLLDAAQAGTRLITAGERGYIFISDDQGDSWRQARTPATSTLTALHFQDSKRGWAVGHDAVILQTEDGGDNWRQIQWMPQDEKPLLQVWFDGPLKGYAVGAYGSFYFSTDGGATWQPKKIVDDDMHINALAHSPNGALFVAGESGMLRRSDDEGDTWQDVPSPYNGSFFGLLALDDGSVLAYGLRGNIFRSADLGRTWQKIAIGTTASLFGSRIFEDGAIALVGYDGTILVSRDAGRSFVLRKSGDGKALAAVLGSGPRDLLLFGESGVTRVASPVD